MYDNFKPIIYANNEKYLPILSFYLTNMHHNLIVSVLNDFFNIQARGGISCAGILANHMELKYKCTGWVRISFNWIMSIKEIMFILDTLEIIIQKNTKFVKFYDYNDNDKTYFLKKNITIQM